jgi:putative ABC transport system permease protein
MIRLALRMLTGDRLKYLGLIAGMAFAAMMIAQQASIFVGLASQTTTFVRERAIVDLWVMDPQIKFSEDRQPMRDTVLQLVRGVEGVEWAVPLYKDWLKVRLPDGTRTQAIVVGLDDATLVGAPSSMDAETLLRLRRDPGILIDEKDAGTKLKLARAGDAPLAVGQRIAINDNDAEVVGTYKSAPSFFWDPIVYTTYARAIKFAPKERNLMSFVMVRAKAGADVETVRRAIEEATGQKAMTRAEFARITMSYILDSTGILVNFGMAVGLGFIVGMISTGQTFFNFTLDNLRYFASLKAMGAGSWLIIRMVLSQVLAVVGLSFGLGVGVAAVMGIAIRKSNLAFEMPWQVPAFTLLSLVVIGVLTGLLSIAKVLRLEPAVVFKS